MAKPDPALLNPARFPFSCAIETRFADLDVNRHLNNVSLTGMVEEARVRFHRASGFIDGRGGLAAMVASLGIEFLGQAFYPAPVTVHAGAARLGRTSYTLDVLLTQEGRTVVFAQSVMVAMAPQGPAELPAAVRAAMQEWMLKP
ncbi:MAG: acyl-CoA thioesterase [Sphingomonadales bacterium]|nr:acyl-CoA thioesterase [Sphingomonadales bacterium]